MDPSEILTKSDCKMILIHLIIQFITVVVIICYDFVWMLIEVVLGLVFDSDGMLIRFDYDFIEIVI